jgi:SSS family solute:Na+ symporter
VNFNPSDFAVVVAYFTVSLGASLYGSGFLRRKKHADAASAGEADKSALREFFVSGGRTPFWLAGTGMVATTFAADTPLAVAGFVGRDGIAGNWIWWCFVAGGMLTVFFFARLWRRSGLTTDLELIELRYGGKPAALLRGTKAIYFGLIINCIIMGWVNLAMLKIFQGMFPEINAQLLLTATALFTTVYVAISGLWGVQVSDAFQFIIAMTGCIVLAVIASNHPSIQAAGGIAHALPEGAYRFFPVIGEPSSSLLYTIPLGSFLAFTCIQWWACWYPGAEPGGGGYIAQRILSARDERHGILATLWFVIAHYCVRPWPWIVAGVAALALYPELSANQKENGYVYLMRDLLPSPLRGLLIAAFLGAYMSTLATHLNWGASYLVHDFYRRFLKRDETDAHYLKAARAATVFLIAASLFVTFFLLDTIGGAWALLVEFGAGTGFVLILRWYYWRINAWSEITAMIAPALMVLVFHLMRTLGVQSPLIEFPVSLFVIVAVTIAASLIVTACTAPESEETLRNFYNRVRPAGPGFARFGKGAALAPKFIGWIAGTVFTYAVLFLLGSLIFDRKSELPLYAGLSGVSLALLVYAFRKDEKPA